MNLAHSEQESEMTSLKCMRSAGAVGAPDNNRREAATIPGLIMGSEQPYNVNHVTIVTIETSKAHKTTRIA